jgi:glyoxylase-like metal-dependent hydrolase (beta-lactamase superfamily II)
VSGDIAMTTMPGFSSPSSKLSVWLQSLNRFEQLKPVRIVPSHGPMGDVSMVTRWKTLMTTVQARAAELKKQGRTLDDTVKMIQDEMQDRYPRNGLAGVTRAAYNEAP